MQEGDYSYQSPYCGYLCVDLAHPIVLVFLSRLDSKLPHNFRFNLDAYFVVERYVDQLDEERLFENPVMPRTMVLVAGPQVTAGVAPPPTYAFTEPQQSFGRGQGPNNVA